MYVESIRLWKQHFHRQCHKGSRVGPFQRSSKWIPGTRFKSQNHDKRAIPLNVGRLCFDNLAICAFHLKPTTSVCPFRTQRFENCGKNQRSEWSAELYRKLKRANQLRESTSISQNVLVISLRKSTPPQNRQLIVYCYCLTYSVDSLVRKLTFQNWLINTFCEIKSPDRRSTIGRGFVFHLRISRFRWQENSTTLPRIEQLVSSFVI